MQAKHRKYSESRDLEKEKRRTVKAQVLATEEAFDISETSNQTSLAEAMSLERELETSQLFEAQLEVCKIVSSLCMASLSDWLHSFDMAGTMLHNCIV